MTIVEVIVMNGFKFGFTMAIGWYFGAWFIKCFVHGVDRGLERVSPEYSKWKTEHGFQSYDEKPEAEIKEIMGFRA